MAQRGFLPVSGGWTEQPFAWIEAIEIVDAQLALVQARRAQELREARERGNAPAA